MRIICKLTFLVVLLFVFGRAKASEYPLKFEVHQMFHSVFKTRANNFFQFFRKAQDTQFDPTGLSAVVTISEIWDKEKKYFTNDAAHVNYLHLLRIYVGMNSSSEVEMIFEPLYADCSEISKDPATFVLERAELTGSTYYRISGKNLVAVDPSLVKEMVTRYRSNTAGIWINSTGTSIGPTDPNWRRFNNLATIYGDTKTIIIPFREIEHFFPSNTDLYFTHVAEWDEAQGANMLKHAIVLSNSLPANSNSRSLIADLGSLCPVNCPDVKVSGNVLSPLHKILLIISSLLTDYAIIFYPVLLVLAGITYRIGYRKGLKAG